jgi:hypothetical protein
VVVAVLFGPFLFIMAVRHVGYDMSRILADPYNPRHQLRDLVGRYFWDTTNVWGGPDLGNYNTQFDLLPLAFIAAGLLVILWPRRLWPKTYFNLRTISRPAWWVLGFLTMMLVTVVFMQTKYSLPFYEYFPGAGFIQFPWRLLGVSTPVAIACALMVMTFPQFLRARSLENVAALALAAGMIYTCGAYAEIQYGAMGGTTLRTPTNFSMNGEYAPVNPVKNPRINEACREVQKHATPPDSLIVPFSVTCSEAGTAVLPFNRSPGHRVRVGDKVMLCGVYKKYPTRCAVDLPAGESYVLVSTATVNSVVTGLWYQLRAALGDTDLLAVKP